MSRSLCVLFALAVGLGASAAPDVLVVPAVEDVGIRSSSPAANYSTIAGLYAGTYTTTLYRSYARFKLPALTEGKQITSARLAIWARNTGGTAPGAAVYTAGDDWSQDKLTWSNAPPPSAEPLGSFAVPTQYTEYSLDVTAAVVTEEKGDGVLTLVLAETSPTQGAWERFYEINESVERGPRLLLECSSAPPPDTTPPTMTFRVLKSTLWPPNHELVLCADVTDVADDRDPSPQVGIEVTSSEAATGAGSGQTITDYEVRKVGEGWEIWLRAERAGAGDGRTYTINVVATDNAGNATRQSATVTVSHDQGKGKGT